MGSNKNKINNKNKYTKITTLLTAFLLLTVDIAPFMGYAVEEINKEEPIEELEPEEDGLEEEIETEEDIIEIEVVEDEDVEDEHEEEYEGEGLGETREDIKLETGEYEEDVDIQEEVNHEPQVMNLTMASISSTPTYKMAQDSDFSGTTNGSFRYIGNDEYVEIPHTIKGVNVTSYERMFQESGVKGVKSTNKNVNNMRYMFHRNDSGTLDVSQLDTSGVTNMTGMFSGVDGGQNKINNLIGLENFNTSNVTAMASMFANSDINHINVSNFDTSNVTGMSRMFYVARSSTIEGIGNFDTSKVTLMNTMFSGSTAKELDVSSFDTSNVRDMNSMFHNTSATMIKGIENFNTSKVTSMADMFRIAEAEELNVSNFDTRNVTSMKAMFEGAKAISIKGLEGFNTTKVSNMDRMFKGTRVMGIDLRSFNTSNVTRMEGMFQDTIVTEIDLSNFSTLRLRSAKDMFYNSKASIITLGKDFTVSSATDLSYMFAKTNAKELDVSSFNTSNVNTMESMFMESEATSILGLETFNTVRVTNMGNMFNGAKTKELNVTNFNTNNVDNMSNMFKNTSAEVLDLKNFNTFRITDMSSMFEGSKAHKIDLSGFDTSSVHNMSSMFKNTEVDEMDLSSFDMSSVNDTEDMFMGAKASKGLARSSNDAEILNRSKGKPDGLEFIPKYEVATDEEFSGTLNGYFRYEGNKDFVEIPHTIKGVNVNNYSKMFSGTSVRGVVSTNTNVTDMSYMFEGNTSKDLDIRGLNTGNVTNMEGMFKDTSTKNIDLSNMVTDNVTNMNRMFENSNFEELDLGTFVTERVKTIDNMFRNAKATVGYARSEVDLNNYNNSIGKPTGLKFTVWSITTKQDTREWTNESVTIEVTSNNDQYGIDFIEMINGEGRNEILGSHFDNGRGEWGISSASWEVKDSVLTVIPFGTNIDFTFIHMNKLLEQGETYTLSLRHRNNVPLNFRGGVNVSGYGGTIQPTDEWKESHVTFRVTKSDVILRLYFGFGRGLETSKMEIDWMKLEKGRVPTPWTLAPEDLGVEGNSKEYQASVNGSYIFRVTDTGGFTKTVSHTVSNIDTEKPTAEITPSTSGWTSQDVTLYVNAEDDLSGVKSIQLPDGKNIEDEYAEYIVKDNGTYTFKITDKAGNTSTVTEEVTNIDRSVPELTATRNPTNWTRDPVTIKVKSGETVSGLTGIEMLNETSKGDNLLYGTYFKGNIGDTVPEGWGSGRGINGRGTGTTEIVKSPWNNGAENAFHIKVSNDRYYLTTDRYIPVTPGDKVTLSMQSTSNSVTTWYNFLDDNYESVQFSSQARFNHYKDDIYYQTFTVPDNARYYHLGRIGVGTPERTTGEAIFGNIKFEVGDKPTEWKPSREDGEIVNNTKTYVVDSNGLYTFQAIYNNEMTSEVSVNVTNIDREKPKISVLDNPIDWVEDDEITLNIKATDTLSGVKSITLPDGKEVNGDTATYKVSENGDYEFTVIDNIGNITTHTETVEYLMIPYNFYVYDNDGNPIKGSEFELLRNSERYKRTTSDKEGLVDFGKIPPVGQYTIRQISSGDGGAVIPGDIEIEDPTDPVEIINHPRGEELPSTGTVSTIITVLIAVTSTVMVSILGYKKRKTN